MGGTLIVDGVGGGIGMGAETVGGAADVDTGGGKVGNAGFGAEGGGTNWKPGGDAISFSCAHEKS